jgi:hypothetical protein
MRKLPPPPAFSFKDSNDAILEDVHIEGFDHAASFDRSNRPLIRGFRAKRNPKRTIISIVSDAILTILLGLLIAYLTYRFGWTG